jgi:pectinesterase
MAIVCLGTVLARSSTRAHALQARGETPRANAIVAVDGSGDYRTVQEAINAVPQNTSAGNRWIIFIKAGTYRELIYVQREKRFVTLVGEDPARTVLTYNLNANMMGVDGKPIGTFRTPSTVIDADDFTAENLTFENSAGPVGQALALRVDGDRVVFRNCRFLGWQDTIFLNRGRQYFEDSLIAGHVDFIFGGATAFFERCRLHCWRNGYITAASTPADERYGFVFANGRITGASAEVKTYLGRPWRDFAQVTFIDMEMSDVVRPEGWHNWDRPEREKTTRYSEYATTGPGANPRARVSWAKGLSAEDAKRISITSVLRGADGWDPRRVPAQPSGVKVINLPVPQPPR